MFSRKLKRIIITKSNQISIIKLCVFFLITTCLLTSYLYGLIEINSNRIVLNLNPVQINNKNRKLNENDNDYVINDEKNRNLVINLNENIIIGDESNIANEKSNEKRKIFLYKEKSIFDYEISKNYTSFFLSVKRVNYLIQNSLTKDEIIYSNSEKFKIESKILERHEKLKEELRKEMERVKKAETDNLDKTENKNKADNKNDENKEDDDEDNENKSIRIKTVLDLDENIDRDLLIKFLKLEKYKRNSRHVKTVKELLDKYEGADDFNKNELPEIWFNYFNHINELQLYNNTNNVNKILKSMSRVPVANCNEKEKGTQIKLILILEDGTEVLVKPMKVPRNYETPPDHFYFVDFERHHAEIAAFHVDRLLGFHRVPPTVGRVFNMTTELWQKAEEDLARTFFYSPAGNVCFTGHCSYYCDTTHAICGRPGDRMEGSVQLMLPSIPIVKWETNRHPYRRTYTKRRKAEWELDDSYCEQRVFRDTIYHSKLLLDLMDLSVFDFITSNMDRHHFERMISLGNHTFPIHLDNGRSFGKIFRDEISILAPLKQCCLIRFSTYERLKYLYLNQFSKLLDESLKLDPLYPILTKDHYKSVDRRLGIIFNELMTCTDKHGITNVIIDDGY